MITVIAGVAILMSVVCVCLIYAIITWISGSENKAFNRTLRFWLLLVLFGLPVKFTNNLNNFCAMMYLFTFWMPFVGYIFVLRRIVIENRKSRDLKHLLIVAIFCGIITVGSIYLPQPSEQEAFHAYEKCYSVVSETIFNMIDTGEIDVEEFVTIEVQSLECKEMFDKETYQNIQMLRWNNSLTSIDPQKNAIYFRQSVMYQSVEGMVVYRNIKEKQPLKNPDNGYLATLIQSPHFQYFQDNMYGFDGGL